MKPIKIFQVASILNCCGKDMANKYDIHHWDNPMVKSLAIVLLELCKGGYVYLVYHETPVATFTIRKHGTTMHFGKLATLPEFSGKGIGTWCMDKIEKMAKDQGCTVVSMELYDKSDHAKKFYKKKATLFAGK